MESDAYLEFLSANSGRSYPFVEDSSVQSDDESFSIPGNLFLDLRGFSRGYPDGGSPELYAIIGPDASPDTGVLQETGNHWNFIFLTGSVGQLSSGSSYLRISILDSEIQALTEAKDFMVIIPSVLIDLPPSIADQGGVMIDVGSQIYDHIHSSMLVTISPDASQSLPPSDSRLIFSGAKVEPALFPNLWKSEIDQLLIEDRSGNEVNVSGDVRIIQGHNVKVVHFEDSLEIHAIRGAGLGVQSTEDFLSDLSGSSSSSMTVSSSGGVDQDFCDGILKFVNGLGPDEIGDFKITGGEGVTVSNYPSKSLIVIEVTRPQLNVICPPVEHIQPSGSSSPES